MFLGNITVISPPLVSIPIDNTNKSNPQKFYTGSCLSPFNIAA